MDFGGGANYSCQSRRCQGKEIYHDVSLVFSSRAACDEEVVSKYLNYKCTCLTIKGM